LLFVLSGLTQYVGAAVAVRLFGTLPATTIAWLRIAISALILLLWARPWRAPLRGRRLATAAAFGVVLAAMNTTFYVAIAHLPLGNVVAIEFLGPVAVAAITGRGWRDRSAIGVALVGVVLVAGVSLGTGPQARIGLLASLAAAVLWGGYIVLGRRVAGQNTGLSGLAVGMAAGALVYAPFFAGSASPVLHDWRLALGVVAVAVCSSVIPYGIEQVVLRRVTAATFAVLLALLPVCSVVVGAVLLHQLPNAAELVGILLVCGAIALTGRPDEAVTAG
jgi:inner membrane transporter RhtA